MNKTEITNLIKSIHSYLHNISDKNMIDIILANEINSANYVNCYYKLDSLYQHNYQDYHFIIGSDKYDVFVYVGERIDESNLLQVILCNNYIEIIKFAQGNYDNGKKVCYCHNSVSIYSFFDSSVIAIRNANSECEYERLSE